MVTGLIHQDLIQTKKILQYATAVGFYIRIISGGGTMYRLKMLKKVIN